MIELYVYDHFCKKIRSLKLFVPFSIEYLLENLAKIIAAVIVRLAKVIIW